ncbi:MAG: transcriptional repressor, partial [Alphaproteobacteria bacterium]|nr:transcriptional repressor [Alphaproteobacteria bacterium]
VLSSLLFDDGHRHVTAEKLRCEVAALGKNMSLATIYNTLNQFAEVGLLRDIKLDDGVTYFDSNRDHHHHFFDPESNALIDIPGDAIQFKKVPMAPDGQQIERVDVIIRLK